MSLERGKKKSRLALFAQHCRYGGLNCLSKCLYGHCGHLDKNANIYILSDCPYFFCGCFDTSSSSVGYLSFYLDCLSRCLESFLIILTVWKFTLFLWLSRQSV